MPWWIICSIMFYFPYLHNTHTCNNVLFIWSTVWFACHFCKNALHCAQLFVTATVTPMLILRRSGQPANFTVSCEVNPRDRYTILFHIVYLDSSLGWEWNEVVGPKMNSMSLRVIWSFHSGEGDGDGSVLGSPMPFHCLSFLPEWNISSHHIISGALKKVGQFQSLACQIKRGSWCTVPWWPWCNLASWFKRGYSHRRYILGLTRNAILGLCRWLTLTNHVWPRQSHKLEYLLIPWPVGLTFSSIFFERSIARA